MGCTQSSPPGGVGGTQKSTHQLRDDVFEASFSAELEEQKNQQFESQKKKKGILVPANGGAESAEESSIDDNDVTSGVSTTVAAAYYLNRIEALMKPTDQGDDKVKHSEQYLEGTRLWLFEDIKAWILSKDPKINRAFWIDGTGGLGKSIIAAKLIDKASEENSWLSIGAYFFCKHDDDRRNNPYQVVATLAFQLSKNIPTIAASLSKLDPNHLSALCSGVTGDFEEVFEALIALPLREAVTSWPSSKRMCILLDALDEISQGPGRSQLLQLVGKGLLSLPAQVFMIVTSRPDPDIVSHLSLVWPLKIDRMEERQMDDLRLYTKQKIINETSLNLLSSEKEKDEILDILTGKPNDKKKKVEPENLDLGKSDGVFLALRYISEHLKGVDKSRNLRLDDVISLPPNMVDSTYRESLIRIDKRIKSMTGSEALKDNPKTYISTVLATLVVSRRPLTVEELCNFCGGSVGEMDESLVMEVLNSFSLLFSYSKNRPIEPLHKSVFDFLLDRARSGEFAVDVRLGHMTMALSCARSLKEGVFRAGAGKSIFDDVDRICDGRMDSSSLYALKFGHVHLSHAITALLDEEKKVTGQMDAKKSGDIDAVIKVWEALLLTKRILPGKKQLSSDTNQEDSKSEEVDDKKMKNYCWEFESVEGKKTRFYKSRMMAKECCLKWVLLQAKLGRSNRFTVELEALYEAMSKLPYMHRTYRNTYEGGDIGEEGGGVYDEGGAGSDGTRKGASTSDASDAARSNMSFNTFLSTTIWLLGSYFNGEWETRKTKEGGLRETTELVFQNVPATSEWFESPAARNISCKMTLPLRVGISQLKKTLIGHTNFVSSVVFNSDGSKIVSGSVDNTVKVWDAVTGEVIQTLKGHSDPVSSVAFSSDGSKIVSGSDDNTVKVWNAVTGEVIQMFKGHTHFVMSVAFSSEGSKIVSGSIDRTVKVWDSVTGEVIQTLKGHSDPINSVAFSSDGLKIVSGSADNTVKVWDAVTGEVIQTLNGHTNFVCSVAFSSDGSKIVSGSVDNTVKVWNAVTGEVIQTLNGHSENVRSVAFSSDGSKILSGSGDNTVKVWDAVIGQVIQTLMGHSDSVNSVAFSSDGSKIVSGSADNTLKVWDAVAEGEIQTLKGHSENVSSVAYSSDGSKIVSGSWDKTVKVWDTATGEVMQTLKGHSHFVMSASFSSDGSKIVSGSYDKTVKEWDAVTGEVIQTLNCHSHFVMSASFSSDGSKIVSGSHDKTVKVWDAVTGEVIQTLKGHSDPVSSIAFSSDGSKIVSGSIDKTVKVWDAVTGEVIKTLKGHSDPVSSVAYSRYGLMIVSGSRDKTVKLWDAVTGEVIQTLNGHTSDVSSVAFSSDGMTIVSGSRDNTVKVWSLNIAPEVDPLLTLTNRWKSFVIDPASETVLMSGLFEKKSGGVLGLFEHRLLVLTDKPCLYYVDILGSEATKGTIEWGPRGHPKASLEQDKSGSTILSVLAPESEDRTFLFRSYDKSREYGLLKKHHLTIHAKTIQIVRGEGGVKAWVTAINSLNRPGSRRSGRSGDMVAGTVSRGQGKIGGGGSANGGSGDSSKIYVVYKPVVRLSKHGLGLNLKEEEGTGRAFVDSFRPLPDNTPNPCLACLPPLQVNDTIVGVNNTATRSYDELVQIIRSVIDKEEEEEGSIVLWVERTS